MTDAAPTDHAASAPSQGPSAATAAEAEERQRLPLSILSLLALVLGAVTGFGAVLFRDLIGLIHNLMFTGHLAVHYDANVFTGASPWGWGVVLVPVVGAVIVTFLVDNFAPEAKGHGVPEVMDAIYYKGGVIRPVVALIKSLASAIAIGSGSSVGREGPIIQIGSALGSTLGQIIRMPTGQRIALVAAGAGAGIAATFNTPIGGVMFAIELMMPEVSVDTFLPVAIATGAATFVGRWFFGDAPAFQVPSIQALNTDPSALIVLALFAVLGALTGAAAAGFIRGLHLIEDLFDKIGGRYLRHMLGMAAGRRPDGRALRPVRPVLRRWRGLRDGAGGPDGRPHDFLAARAVVPGEGAGHVAEPRFRLVGRHLLALAVHGRDPGRGLRGRCSTPPGLPLQLSVPAFAMVGMGAMVGGGTGAVMTAVAMIFEMTLDYAIVMPMIVAVAISVGVRRVLSRETIYTLKLVRRGQAIPKARHANMFLVRQAREVMDTDILVLPAEASFEDYLRQPEHAGRLRHVVVTRNGHLFGVVRVNTGIRRGLEGAAYGRHPRRRREPQFHRRRRERHRLRRHPPHVAQGRDHGRRGQRPRGAARPRRGRRHHQGACGRLGRGQREDLSALVAALRPEVAQAAQGTGDERLLAEQLMQMLPSQHLDQPGAPTGQTEENAATVAWRAPTLDEACSR